MAIQLPVRERLKLTDKEVITREFPPGANIRVKVGDTVAPETVLADYETSRGFRVFHLRTLLGISGKHAEKYVKRRIGSRVYSGEIIAEKKGLLPFKKKVFRSPIDGTIQSVSAKGDMTVSMLPAHSVQPALYWGKVVGITPTQLPKAAAGQGVVDPKTTPLTLPQTPKVSIQTQSLTIFGMMGSGKKRDGYLSVGCAAEDFYLPQHMEATAANSIIVCGALIEHGVLEMALKYKVAGLVAGGIHLRDATAMGIKIRDGQGLGTDVGVSILVTEGFGPVTINQDHYDLLKRYSGRYVVIDGNAGQVSIPLKPEEVTQVSANQAPAKDQTVEAQIGMIVRVLDTTYFGKIGRITKIHEKPTKLASELVAALLTISLKGETTEAISIPAVSVEAII